MFLDLLAIIIFLVVNMRSINDIVKHLFIEIEIGTGCSTVFHTGKSEIRSQKSENQKPETRNQKAEKIRNQKSEIGNQKETRAAGSPGF